MRLFVLFASLWPALSLVGCHVFAAKQPPPVTTGNTGPSPPSLAVGPPPAGKIAVEHLQFEVDASRSTGLIATTLDPLHLGARHSKCRCPLRGTIDAKLTTSADGTKSLALESIDLATNANGHLKYDWTPLIGSIKGLIPTGILTIKDHTIPGPLVIDQRGTFRRAGYRFKVGGTCKVQGHGLLLKKRVGQSEEDLTIAKTEPVVLNGTLIRRAGEWILRIPSALMKDRFEIDDEGSTLDLAFTGNITAVAR